MPAGHIMWEEPPQRATRGWLDVHWFGISAKEKSTSETAQRKTRGKVSGPQGWQAVGRHVCGEGNGIGFLCRAVFVPTSRLLHGHDTSWVGDAGSPHFSSVFPCSHTRKLGAGGFFLNLLVLVCFYSHNPDAKEAFWGGIF